MKSMTLASLVFLAAAAGCGDDDGTAQPDGGDGADGPGNRSCSGNGGADCFDLPTAPMAIGAEATAPDFTCGAVTVETRDTSLTVSGTVYDFQNDTEVIPNAVVDAFLDDITGTPLMSATADSSGNYSISLPMSKNRMQWRTTRPTGGLPTYAINDPLDISGGPVTDFTRRNVSLTTANALPALIGVERTPGLGVVAGEVADCAGESITHAVGTLASAPSDGNPANIQFVSGAAVYYFNGNFPVRHMEGTGRLDSSENGLFVVIEIPPSGSQVYLQVWGWLTAADMAMGQAGLTLISETPTPVIADSVIASTMEPNKGPF